MEISGHQFLLKYNRLIESERPKTRAKLRLKAETAEYKSIGIQF